MSGCEPWDVDCVEVLQQVYLYLDGEIDETRRVEVRTHIEDCAGCLREFGIEQEVKVLVARCCGGDAAPPELESRLRYKLSQITIDMTRVEFRPE